jgi:hypothetical protein
VTVEPEGDGWVLLGYTDRLKVYDADGREIELVRPDPLPDGVEIGEIQIFYGGPARIEPGD